MNLFVRLFLTIPFVFVTFLYYKTYDPDQRCIGGFIDTMILLVFYGFLLLTGLLAGIATLRKRQSENLNVEPITCFISFSTLLFLGYSLTLRGHTKGADWIHAESNDSNNQFSTRTLTLRENGNFTVDLNNINLECSISGSYEKNGDTLFLDSKTISKTDEKMATVYLMKSDRLIPLFDTTDKRIFNITEIR